MPNGIVAPRGRTVALMDSRLRENAGRVTQGKGPTVATSQDEIVAAIAEIIEEVTGIEPSEVTLDKAFIDDLDIDSLSMVEIAVQLEDKYGVKVPDEDLAGLKTVGDAVAYIQKLEAENADLAAELKGKYEAEKNK
ncbi:hypothetical protein GCM10027289_06640 [Tsukamurella serpentis]